MARIRLSRLGRHSLAIAGITLVFFLLFEGSASILLLLHSLQSPSQPPRVNHTEFDPQLGWANRPNVAIRDFYGPGKHITINSQGFRNEEGFDVKIPHGMRRVICLGDSFTLGFGVSNEDTWCSLLSAFDTSLQAVNMGQGGYGIDQAYLWYVRDGLLLEHNLLIMAFISDDFERMVRSRQHFYGKPRLTLERGELRVQPAKRYTSIGRWFFKNGHLFRDLRSVEFSGRLLRRLGIGSNRQESRVISGPPPPTRGWELAEAVFERLARVHTDRGTQLVLVFLPHLGSRDAPQTELRRAIAEFARDRGVQFVDLISEYRKLDSETIEALFIPGDRHLSELGNRWVAERLVEEIPELSRQ